MARVSFPQQRYARRHGGGGKEDQRDPAQRDRDRILYTSALRRLAGVTQVVGPSEGHIFHNRLTHTLEVAQIARRLAEHFLRTNQSLTNRLGGVDPDVVEAAALAHDLGHPPFGHIAEAELNVLAQQHNAADGFEGNAQSFRILTRSAVHSRDYSGLNLTRATLNAVLKYPWKRDLTNGGSKKHEKFGAYVSEEEDLEFARKGYEATDRQSVEAAIMDYADDIAYSIHDLDDFYRAGLVPLHTLATDGDEFESFVRRWKQGPRGITSEQIDEYRNSFLDQLRLMPVEEQYQGTTRQRARMRSFSSAKIGEYVNAVALRESDAGEVLTVPDYVQFEMRFFQRLVWDYVITNPRLATQQHGERRIIRTLFEVYIEAVWKRNRGMVPPRFQGELEELKEQGDSAQKPHPLETRVAVDIVASFTDDQAVSMYRRLMGVSPGSVAQLLHG